VAATALAALLIGGGRAALGVSGGSALEAAASSLRPEALASASSEETGASVEALAREAALEGIAPREAFEKAFPPAPEVLAMLALDRDLDDFLEYGARDDAAGGYYRDQAESAKRLRPLRSRYEAAYAAAYRAFGGSGSGAAATLSGPAAGRRRPYVAAPGDVWLPPRRELALSHPYALDVFFMRVERSGPISAASAERGPTIRALYPGIVVASASDWQGGDGAASWKGGGLSPAAGDGLVIYDPATRRYCSYFHLSSVARRSGDIVSAGEVLGRGGNTGMNARKAGHGEHVHIEIFDCARDASLYSTDIYELLRR
jgi:murein DD-endopeptidase MepM/ murein hydrolase activator NlpD